MPRCLTRLPLGPLKPMGPRDPGGPCKKDIVKDAPPVFLFSFFCSGALYGVTGSCLHHCYNWCVFALSVQTKSTEHSTEVSDSFSIWGSDVDLQDCLVLRLGRSLQGFLGAPVSDDKHVKQRNTPYKILHYKIFPPGFTDRA